ncbi:hypothetical protein OF83DRAFT_1252351, partial [Amylostereum chailletii]
MVFTVWAAIDSPHTMASKDNTLQILGNDLLESFVAVTVETFFFSVYTILILKTTSIFLRRKGRRPASFITLAAVIVLFLLDAVLWIIDVRNIIIELKITLISDSDDTLEAKYGSAGETVLNLVSVQALLYAYMTIIGDCIIIWRAYAFWSHGKEKLVLLLPGAMLLASIISTIMLTYCVDRLGGDIVGGAFLHPALCRNMQETSYAATVATTAVATFLIGYKTWQYRRSIQSSIDESVPKTRVEKVMIILVESGVLYFLFFLSPVIFSIGDLQAREDAKTNLKFAGTVYQYLTSTVVGIYPTVIVVLVKSQLSFID